MPSCQLCGKESDDLKKVKVEGATLSVCDSCEDLGESVETRKKKKSTGGGSSRPRESQVLINDYGKKLKEAREAEGISLKEVADELNEKSSLISKIEKQELKPDKPLAKKLSKRFDLDLYTNPEVSDHDTGNSPDSRKATLGDVAEIKD